MRKQSEEVERLNKRIRDLQRELHGMEKRFENERQGAIVAARNKAQSEINDLKNKLDGARQRMKLEKERHLSIHAEQDERLRRALIQIGLYEFPQPENVRFLTRLATPIYTDVGVFAVSRTITKNRRAYIHANDLLCRYCLNAPANTIDFVWPVAYGGPNCRENLVGACEQCNRAKGSLLPHEWDDRGIRLHLPARLYSTYLA